MRKQAIEVAKLALAKAPALIPIYGRRYIPSEPHARDNPILSVPDFVNAAYFGFDLPGYLNLEFKVPLPSQYKTGPTIIRFWDEVLDW